ncbi:hypothetical protein FSP39_002643 [Pinctada imbricata]|uniref:Uncharacterized protein n=1 Tax=Pinctada imbricata TaxID=66713 RepID=A0AA88XCD0_PINIB|nr:hypothetical protein FSP39_002643 [Pinctada imbricata]
MPRHRVKAVSSKKPLLPDGDEGKQLSREEKRAKLEIFLKDLDSRAEKFRQDFKTDYDKMCKLIEQAYTMEIARLPPAVREMKFVDFLACGGTVETAMEHLEKEKEKENNSSLTTATSLRTQRTVSRTRVLSQKTMLTEAIPEEGSNMTVKTNTKTTSALRTPWNQFKTPMHRSIQQMGFETPLITPKFDPRLPVTPQVMRKQKDMEVVLSLGGSPLQSRHEELREMFNVDVDLD